MRKAPRPSKSPTSARELRLQFHLLAPPARVWTALVKETAAWWPTAFHTSPKTKRFILEPKLGGMMGEITAPGEGLVWYRVIGVEAGVSLTLAGYLLPPWAGPATSLLRLTLEPEEGGTRLDLCDACFGHLGNTRAMAEGWTQIFAGHLKPHVERPRRRR